MAQERKKTGKAKASQWDSRKLRSKKFKDKKDLIISISGKSNEQLQNIAPEQFLLIKEKIRRRARKEARKMITFLGILTILSLLLAFILYRIAQNDDFDFTSSL